MILPAYYRNTLIILITSLSFYLNPKLYIQDPSKYPKG